MTNFTLSHDTGKYTLVVSYPTKIAYGPFTSIAEAAKWFSDRINEHKESSLHSVYVEIMPYFNPVKD